MVGTAEILTEVEVIPGVKGRRRWPDTLPDPGQKPQAAYLGGLPRERLRRMARRPSPNRASAATDIPAP